VATLYGATTNRSIADYIPDPVQHQSFSEATKEFRAEVSGWRRWLLGEYVNAVRVQSRNGYVIRNKAGKCISLDESEPSQIAAHILQGFEAAFIHTLTYWGTKTGAFEVVSNEHDGLVTLGAIPDDVLRATKDQLGLSIYDGFELVEKSLQSQ
jgi:hypothetical protein